MKKLFTPIAIVLLTASGIVHEAFSQHVQPAERPCIADEIKAEEEANDPEVAKRRAELEEFISKFVAEQEKSGNKTSGAVKIIPVVVHVIHEGGDENISKAQIEDAMRVLNEDFRKLNADAGDVPAAFASRQADCEIEFRLAQIDPNGNCTDGITRTYSELTNNARNNVKGLIQWPPDDYMNVWTVKSIENTSGSSGTIIGFATFPGGNPSNDGVVVRSNYMGSIGTALFSNYNGRTFTHEVGHYMSLYHIWGSDGCSWGDQVSDTPNQETNNTGCPSFPQESCSNGVNGDLFMDYMDYTNGSCQNTFTEGQKTRMHGALNSDRSNLWSTSNLIATGTNGSPVTLCAPHAEFSAQYTMICQGDSTVFTDESWNGNPDTWSWSFPGGSPSSSNDSVVTVTYNTPGTYNVTLTASNSGGNDSEVKNGYIVVSPIQAPYNIMPFTEGFESTVQFNQDWVIINGDGQGWARYPSAGYNSSSSMRLRNYYNDEDRIDIAISPAYDIDSVLNPKMTFKLAYAQTASDDLDRLRVYVSTDCGKTWAIRLQKTGGQLASVGIRTSEFTPSNSGEWIEQTVSLGSYSGADNVRFMFELLSDVGNNIFIDDINITGSGYVGIDDPIKTMLNVSAYPNPFEQTTNIRFNLNVQQRVSIAVYDVLGKEIATVEDKKVLAAGEHHYTLSAEELNGKGVYFVRFLTEEGQYTHKLLMN